MALALRLWALFAELVFIIFPRENGEERSPTASHRLKSLVNVDLLCRRFPTSKMASWGRFGSRLSGAWVHVRGPLKPTCFGLGVAEPV